MKINNRSRAIRFKRIFYFGSVIIAIGTLGLFLTKGLLGGLGGLGVFSLWYLYFNVADYLFIEFKNDENRILLRYFKAITFGKPHYNEIDFPVQMLKNVRFENSIFGKQTDVTFFVQTKRGIAEYPSVSLSAVKDTDRQKMASALHELLHN